MGMENELPTVAGRRPPGIIVGLYNCVAVLFPLGLLSLLAVIRSCLESRVTCIARPH